MVQARRLLAAPSPLIRIATKTVPSADDIGRLTLACQRLSSECSFTFMLLDVGRDTLDDLVGVAFVVNDVGVQVARSAQLELCRVALLVLLDGDFACGCKVFCLTSHQLDEVLQFLDFLRLQRRQRLDDEHHSTQTRPSETYHFD